MLKKSYSKKGRECRVTFNFHPGPDVKAISLCGDFNDWNPAIHPMKQRKDGSFGLVVSLPAGRHYRFRYFMDGQRWMNDPGADNYVPNDFGTEDCLVQV